MKKKRVTRKEVIGYVEKYIECIEQVYGLSKHQKCSPYILLSGEVIDDIKGEYCHLYNEIIVYWKNIGSLEELIRVLIHEYKHYLQSPSWMTRYYKMGHSYDSHPYEIAAYREEENWYKVWEQAS